MEISFEQLCYAAEGMGLQYQAYSGRAMYGEQCFAVECDNVLDAIVSFTAELIASSHENDPEEDIDEIATEVREFLEGARTDSLGRQQVLYWPKIEWQDIPH